MLLGLGIGTTNAQSLTVRHTTEGGIETEIGNALAVSGQSLDAIKELIIISDEANLVKDDCIYIKNNLKTTLETLDLSDATFLNGVIVSGNGYGLWEAEGAFTAMTGLKEVKLPDSVEKLFGGAFSGCTNLKTINFPEGLTMIGSYAFKNCKNLELTKLSETVYSINEQAFNGCTAKLALTSLPSSLKEVKTKAFYQCKGITVTEFPAGLKLIGDDAFFRCSNLAVSELPDILETIGARALRETKVSASKWPSAIKSIGDRCFALTNASFTTWPSNIPTITSGVFVNCPNIKNFTIPKEVTIIGESAFHQTTDVSRDFYFYNHNTPPTLLTTPNGPPFNGAGKLTKIHIPANAKSLYTGDIWSTMTIKTKAVNPVTVLTGTWAQTELQDIDLSDESLVSLDMTGITIPDGTSLGTVANPNCLIYVAEDAPLAEWKNLVRGGIAENIVLTDKKPFGTSKQFRAKSVTLNRTFSAIPNGTEPALETICLPFSVSVPDGCSAMEYTNSTDGEVSFSPVSLLTANTPYVISGNNTVVDFISNEEQDIISTLVPVEKGVYTYNGTYFPMTITGEETNNIYVSDGTKFSKTIAGATIAPFRSYLEGSKTNPASVRINALPEGGATTLEKSPKEKGLDLYSFEGVLLVKSNCPQIINVYALDGRVVRREMITEGDNFIRNLAKGIYIVEHQKIIIE